MDELTEDDIQNRINACIRLKMETSWLDGTGDERMNLISRQMAWLADEAKRVFRVELVSRERPGHHETRTETEERKRLAEANGH